MGVRYYFRQIDAWKRERDKLIEQEREEEQLQNQIFEREVQIQQLLKQRFVIQQLLCSIDSLHYLRSSKLEGKDSLLRNQSDSDSELLRRAKEETATYSEVSVTRKKKEWYLMGEFLIRRVFTEKEEEDDDDSYYFGAQRDINKLISIR